MRVSLVIDNECTSRTCRRGYIGVCVTTSKQIAHAQRKLVPFPAPASTLYSASWVVDRVYVKDSCQVCCTSVRLWLYLFALQTGVHMIRMEVTLGTFSALTIQSTTQTRRDVPGVSQYPVIIAYWLHLMYSSRRETPMFWESTMAPPIQRFAGDLEWWFVGLHLRFQWIFSVVRVYFGREHHCKRILRNLHSHSSAEYVSPRFSLCPFMTFVSHLQMKE